ncbi:hypothetical protein EDC01DRAFT_630481 [Geopyxis carbonaria]|nr:hypothetical protein EDC01DRAFT_630481 [Geopyxis carbonaria]
MNPNTHFKLANGTQEELLTCDNYHTWSIAVQYEMGCDGTWGWVTGERTVPECPPGEIALSERIMWMQMRDSYEKQRLDTGRYILNRCTAYVRECYLEALNANDPAGIWTTLKNALQGNDQSRIEALNRVFRNLSKPRDMRMKEFSHRLHKLQEQTTTRTVGADGSVTVHMSISDNAIKEKILTNAIPEHAQTTRHCEVDPRLTLTDILNMYEAAEKADKARLDQLPKEPLHMISNNGQEPYHSVTAFYGRAQQKPRGNRPQIYLPQPARPVYSERLPMCPADWDGIGCWKHDTEGHTAAYCNTLRFLQKRYLEENRIDPATARQLPGYPHPSAGPAPRGTYNSQSGYQSQNVRNQLNVSQKRQKCGLCDDPNHITDACPDKEQARKSIKKRKTMGTAVPAQRVPREDSVEEDSALPPM